jgi:hypothetical protein
MDCARSPVLRLRDAGYGVVLDDFGTVCDIRILRAGAALLTRCCGNPQDEIRAASCKPIVILQARASDQKQPMPRPHALRAA